MSYKLKKCRNVKNHDLLSAAVSTLNTKFCQIDRDKMRMRLNEALPKFKYKARKITSFPVYLKLKQKVKHYPDTTRKRYKYNYKNISSTIENNVMIV